MVQDLDDARDVGVHLLPAPTMDMTWAKKWDFKGSVKFPRNRHLAFRDCVHHDSMIHNKVGLRTSDK